MQVIKQISLGIGLGTIYAVINFGLFTPYLRDNVVSLVFWGIQGGIFMAIMNLFSRIFPHYTKNYFSCIAVSGTCGLITSSLHIAISWFGRIQTLKEHNAIASEEITKAVQHDLALYSFGWILLGIAIGILLKKNSVQ